MSYYLSHTLHFKSCLKENTHFLLFRKEICTELHDTSLTAPVSSSGAPAVSLNNFMERFNLQRASVNDTLANRRS